MQKDRGLPDETSESAITPRPREVREGARRAHRDDGTQMQYPLAEEEIQKSPPREGGDQIKTQIKDPRGGGKPI